MYTSMFFFHLDPSGCSSLPGSIFMCVQPSFPFHFSLVILCFHLARSLRKINSQKNNVKTVLCSSRSSNYYKLQSSSWKKRAMVVTSGRFQEWFMRLRAQPCRNRFLKLGWGEESGLDILCSLSISLQNVKELTFFSFVYLSSGSKIHR